MIRPYRWLADYYDEIISGSRSPIDRARARILSGILPRVESACDLACGTGTTALQMADMGISTYGVDLSPRMCRIAREKAKCAGLPLRILHSDMRNFRLPQAVDLITCEYDALNHVPQRADLRKVARAVMRALQPGGYFFFDVNNSLGFKRYWRGTVCVEKPDVVLLMRNGHNRQATRAWSDVDWFIRDGTCWRRKQERVEEVCWTADEVHRVLREAGFDLVRAWDAAPFFRENPIVTRGCRTIYLARNSKS